MRIYVQDPYAAEIHQPCSWLQKRQCSHRCTCNRKTKENNPLDQTYPKSLQGVEIH
ncbi:hypothetical protein Hanom_Chr10g00924541 [Helianthus anomalus]